jgi:tRNA threonylcarbamoyladenosine biosynthesis protein TsaE
MVMAQESSGSGGALAMSLADPTDTRAFAARLAPLARPGDVLALTGDLGTGKTTFARGFINALLAAHGLPPEDVPSPTFTLVQEYQLPEFTLYHIDLYRIEAREELFELGLEDAFADGVSLIEWPDRLGSLLPASRLELAFSQGGPDDDQDTRSVLLTTFGNWKGRIKTGALNG